MSPMYDPDWTGENPADQYALSIGRAFLHTFGETHTEKIFGGEWSKQEHSRAPYVDAWKLREGTIALYAHPHLTHCCVEISGQGCEWLIERGLLEAVLSAARSRITRIDLAVDIKTQTRPLEFVKQTTSKRTKSNGYQISGSGETCYVGSQKSDRYARVYRYAKPHPRSDLLRIETVFRREVARTVARSIIQHGAAKVAASVGEHFGWCHADWNMEITGDIDLRMATAERNGGKTVYWLVNSVAPAFRRLVDDGTIRDPDEFIRRYFLGGE